MRGRGRRSAEQRAGPHLSISTIVCGRAASPKYSTASQSCDGRDAPKSAAAATKIPRESRNSASDSPRAFIHDSPSSEGDPHGSNPKQLESFR